MTYISYDNLFNSNNTIRSTIDKPLHDQQTPDDKDHQELVVLCKFWWTVIG